MHSGIIDPGPGGFDATTQGDPGTVQAAMREQTSFWHQLMKQRHRSVEMRLRLRAYID